MSIHQYNTQWWRVRSLPQILRRVEWFLKGLPDDLVILLSPVVPFFLLANEQISFLAALLLTQVPILIQHLVKLSESEFWPSEPTDFPENPLADQYRTSIQREWETGVRERLLADFPNAEAYTAILSIMNHIPNVIGFTTGMGEQMALANISKSVRSAGLTAECPLGHVLYAYAMGWTDAPVPGTGHGAFTRYKAVRVLRQFPEWPDGWEAQLSRVSHPQREPIVEQEVDAVEIILLCIWFITVVVPMIVWLHIRDWLDI